MDTELFGQLEEERRAREAFIKETMNANQTFARHKSVILASVLFFLAACAAVAFVIETRNEARNAFGTRVSAKP